MSTPGTELSIPVIPSEKIEDKLLEETNQLALMNSVSAATTVPIIRNESSWDFQSWQAYFFGGCSLTNTSRIMILRDTIKHIDLKSDKINKNDIGFLVALLEPLDDLKPLLKILAENNITKEEILVRAVYVEPIQNAFIIKLINLGADANAIIPGEKNKTVFSFLIDSSNIEVMKFLLQKHKLSSFRCHPRIQLLSLLCDDNEMCMLLMDHWENYTQMDIGMAYNKAYRTEYGSKKLQEFLKQKFPKNISMIMSSHLLNDISYIKKSDVIEKLKENSTEMLFNIYKIYPTHLNLKYIHNQKYFLVYTKGSEKNYDFMNHLSSPFSITMPPRTDDDECLVQISAIMLSFLMYKDAHQNMSKLVNHEEENALIQVKDNDPDQEVNALTQVKEKKEILYQLMLQDFLELSKHHLKLNKALPFSELDVAKNLVNFLMYPNSEYITCDGTMSIQISLFEDQRKYSDVLTCMNWTQDEPLTLTSSDKKFLIKITYQAMKDKGLKDGSLSLQEIKQIIWEKFILAKPEVFRKLMKYIPLEIKKYEEQYGQISARLQRISLEISNMRFMPESLDAKYIEGQKNKLKYNEVLKNCTDLLDTKDFSQSRQFHAKVKSFRNFSIIDAEKLHLIYNQFLNQYQTLLALNKLITSRHVRYKRLFGIHSVNGNLRLALKLVHKLENMMEKFKANQQNFRDSASQIQEYLDKINGHYELFLNNLSKAQAKEKAILDAKEKSERQLQLHQEELEQKANAEFEKAITARQDQARRLAELEHRKEQSRAYERKKQEEREKNKRSDKQKEMDLKSDSEDSYVPKTRKDRLRAISTLDSYANLSQVLGFKESKARLILMLTQNQPAEGKDEFSFRLQLFMDSIAMLHNIVQAMECNKQVQALSILNSKIARKFRNAMYHDHELFKDLWSDKASMQKLNYLIRDMAANLVHLFNLEESQIDNKVVEDTLLSNPLLKIIYQDDYQIPTKSKEICRAELKQKKWLLYQLKEQAQSKLLLDHQTEINNFLVARLGIYYGYYADHFKSEADFQDIKRRYGFFRQAGNKIRHITAQPHQNTTDQNSQVTDQNAQVLEIFNNLDNNQEPTDNMPALIFSNLKQDKPEGQPAEMLSSIYRV